MRTRPNSYSVKGVVSSSSQLASMAGADIIRSGGNLADAAVATSAVLCVTQNNLCGLGGDMFALIRMGDHEIIDLNASGRAFMSASIDYFIDSGLKTLPSRGHNSAITVPGIVSGWDEIHRKFCTMELNDLLSYAIKAAENGFPVTHNYSSSIMGSSRYFSQFDEWKRIFLPNGEVPGPGTVFKQKDLGSSLRSLAENGLHSFYDGDLADRILKGLDGTENLISDTDLIKHRVTTGSPMKTEIGDTSVYETSPNSQGATVILWLNLLQASAGDKEITQSSFRTLLETGLLAYSKRDQEITDPDFHKLPELFTSKDYAEDLLSTDRFDWPGASPKVDRGDTTYFCIADNEGNSLSWIQSNYMGFGSGIIPEGTGFVLQNRGSYFTLDPQHHNALAPGKRTFHTLCAGMLENNGKFQASFGSMGGDIQPQLHIQMVLPLMKDLSDPQGILDNPRWAFPYTIYEKPSNFVCETPDLKRNIERDFRKWEVRNLGFSSQLGHAQIVSLLENGTVAGGADPRGDGMSIPFV